MAHINAIVGSDLVELAGLTQAFSRRELGELRTIAAELQREGYADKESTDFNHVVRALIGNGELSIDDLARAQKFDDLPDGETIDAEIVLITVLEAARRAR